jgi:Fic family protein
MEGIMDYIKVSEAAERWGISARRVRILCAENRIEGVIRRGKLYMIPEDAAKPLDGRSLRAKGFQSPYAVMFKRADQLKAELARRRPLTPGELERLLGEFMVEFTYNSNAIEGNTLTLQETALVLEGLTIDQKPLKDHLEAVGHRDAFLYVQEIVSENKELSVFEIRNIHSLDLMNRPEDKGVFRKVPVRIMGAYTVPAQPYLIEPKITELLLENKKRKKTMHPLERIARFHNEFEGIHPFIDGNGRTGRLLLNLDLMQNGFPPINVKFTDRKRYYDAFDAYYRNDDLEPMLGMITGYVESRLEEYLEIIG